MEEILASIRRIISDEVAGEPATARNEASRSGREAPTARAASPTREAAPRAAAPVSPRPQAAPADPETLSYAPPPFRERVESPVDYAPRGRAPAADPFASRPVTVAAAALAATPFSPPSVVSRAPATAVYSGGSAARALDVPAPAPVASESRPPEPRRTEPRLFPDSRPMPDLRPLPEVRPRSEPRLVEPRSPVPAGESRAAVAPAAPRPAPTPAVAASAAASMGALPPLRPSYSRPSMAKPPAPLDSDLDKPLAAALLDLALVEQAVQAELANVALTEPVAPLAARSPEAKPSLSAPSRAEPVRPSYVPAPTVAAVPEVPAPVVASPVPPAASAVGPSSAVAPTAEPEAMTAAPATPVAEAATPVVASHPVAEPSELPVPAPLTAGEPASTEPSREARPRGAAPVNEPSARDAEPRPLESRLPEARAQEPRSYEPRSFEGRSYEPRLSELRAFDSSAAEARRSEASPAEARPVTGSRPAPSTEAAEAVRERLVSAPASSAVSAAFSSLQRTMSSLPPRSIDDLVTDALRPMLKEWLDENLPALVERLVRAEIERVARHGQ